MLLGMAVVAAVVALPYLANSQRMARRLTCSARLADAAQTVRFVSELRADKAFPGYANPMAAGGDAAQRPIGWAWSLLPYLDRPLDAKTGEVPGPDVFGPWNKVVQQFGPQGDDAAQGQLPTQYIPQFICPDDARATEQPRQAWTSYVANCGLPDATPRDGLPADWPANGVFLERFHDRDPARQVTWKFIEEHDGAAYTLLFSENVDAGLWTDASEAQVGFLWYPGTPQGEHDPRGELLYLNQERGKSDGSVRFARPSSRHVGGVNVVFSDGHTDFLVDALDYRIYAAYMSPDGPGAQWPASDKPLDPPWREVR